MLASQLPAPASVRSTGLTALVFLLGLVGLGASDLHAQTQGGSGPAASEVRTAAMGMGATAATAPADRTLRIALQAGHWRSHEAPDELARIRSNGTQGGGVHEWQVTLEIAQRAATLLEARGYEVEVLPATIPPGYRADLFIAIHADGFHSPSASGFSVAPPRRDASGRAGDFAEVLAASYGEATALRHRVATRRMQGYYAFNSRRYRHALHPSTPAVIIETGFLTSPRDREVIVNAPDRSALGIATAVERFLPLAAPVVDAGRD